MDATTRTMEKGITMSGWGIAETAPVIEKIKAESADYLSGLNSCGEITWSVYDKAFDFYMELISRAYEQGKKDAQLPWIRIEDRCPKPDVLVLVSTKGEVDADWIAKDSTGYGCWYRSMRGVNDIDAWMPLPEPWKGEQPC